MANLFELLSIPVSLTISNDEVDAAWRSLSQTNHPDISDQDGEVSAGLNAARQALNEPSGRLAEWLRIKGVDSLPRNAALSEALMGLFSSVGEGLKLADQAVESSQSAQTALAKSLLTPQLIQAQKSIQVQLQKIMQARGLLTGRFTEFEEIEDGDFSNPVAALGELKFLEKWERECQQRLVALISID